MWLRVIAGVCWVAGVAQAASAADGVRAQRPNVLFLVADDLSTRVGAYGDAAAVTPALDRLAADGVIFERAYAAGTVCTPSRKSFLTGLGVGTVGWGNNNYLEEHPQTMTLPRWFREHGYQTAKVGKVQHGDEYEGPHDWDINLNQSYDFPAGNAGKLRRRLVSDDGRPVAVVDVRRDDQHSIDQGRTDAFLHFLDHQWNRSQPFFFALGYHAPHEPHEANRRHYEMHPPDSMPLVEPPPGATPMSMPYPENFRHWSDQVPEPVQREALQGYYAAVTGMDEQVGRALDYLAGEGLADDTIIVFTSDQGYCLGYRDCWAKHLLYPPVLRVPLIVRYPGMPNRGSRVAGLVELLDIFPTLTDLAGLPTPDGLHGRSFVPLIQQPGARGKSAARAQGILHRGSGRAVASHDAMYMEWQDGARREFYDLESDPDGWINLVDEPRFAAAVQSHRQLLRGGPVALDTTVELVNYDFADAPTPSQVDAAVVAEGVRASDLGESGDPDGGGSSPALTNFSGYALNIKRNAVDADPANFSDYLEFSLEAADGGRLVAESLELRFNSFSDGFSVAVHIDSGAGFEQVALIGGADNSALANSEQRLALGPLEAAAAITLRMECAHARPGGSANTTLQIAEIGVTGAVLGSAPGDTARTSRADAPAPRPRALSSASH